MLIAPACFSCAEISGAATFEAASDAGAFGRIGAELLRGELQLRPLRLRTRELHDVRKRRQNLGRFLRRFRLDQRLPGMRRMQRLGDNRLPRVERVGAATRRRLRRILSGGGFRCAHSRQDRRKILRGTIPGDLRRRRGGNRPRRLNIPDRRREQDQERLDRDRRHERSTSEISGRSSNRESKGRQRNSFGGAGPRTSAIRLEKNSKSVPDFSRLQLRSGKSRPEESNEPARFVLSCK